MPLAAGGRQSLWSCEVEPATLSNPRLSAHSDDDDPTTMPHLIVTASVDEIQQHRSLDLGGDVMLSGVVTWVGRSSMSIHMEAAQVARDGTLHPRPSLSVRASLHSGLHVDARILRSVEGLVRARLMMREMGTFCTHRPTSRSWRATLSLRRRRASTRCS